MLMVVVSELKWVITWDYNMLNTDQQQVHTLEREIWAKPPSSKSILFGDFDSITKRMKTWRFSSCHTSSRLINLPVFTTTSLYVFQFNFLCVSVDHSIPLIMLIKTQAFSLWKWEAFQLTQVPTFITDSSGKRGIDKRFPRLVIIHRYRGWWRRTRGSKKGSKKYKTVNYTMKGLMGLDKPLQREYKTCNIYR